MKYSNLKIHTEYSILDGTSKISDYVKKAKEFNQDILGITDINLMGAIEFYKECKKNSIKPIIGLKVYINGIFLEGLFPITIYAKNMEGYKNLIKLSSLSYSRVFKDYPKLDINDIIKYKEGLIILVGGYNSELYEIIKLKMYYNIDKLVNYFKKISDDIYFEIFLNNDELSISYANTYLEYMKDEKNIILSDSYYINKEDFLKKSIVNAIKYAKTINEVEKNEKLFFKNDNDFNLFIDKLIVEPNYIDKYKENYNELVNSINIEFDFNNFKFPKYSNDIDFNDDEFLRNICYQNLEIKGLKNTEYIERLEYELSIIKKMRFSSYFIIVWDLIKYAKENSILIGPGRGSAAGSLVSYILNITTVDPIKYGLIFERFLNESRKSMPDIDIDIDSEKREELINYATKKYGANNVFHIITYSKLRPKQALKDIIRILNYEEKDFNFLSNQISQYGNKNIKDVLNNYSIKKRYNEDSKFRKVIDYIEIIENTIRHTSIHAAGIIISPKEYSNYIPTVLDISSNLLYTQYAMADLEELGFVKMDLLALKNLTIIRKTEELIRKETNLKDFDIEKIPLDDEKTFETLNRGNTLGIFQCESYGMTKMIKKLKVNSIEDISLAIALYRPGPLNSGISEEVINRKNGISKIEYIDDSVKDFLNDSYGSIVYQEQVLNVLNVLADYSLSEADNLRKAISKKINEVLKENRTIFCDRLVRKGIDLIKSNKIYDMIETFGEYGFNKSHSTAYAYIAYYTAYLKTNFTKYYLLNLINDMQENETKFLNILKDIKMNKLNIYPISINKSYPYFNLEEDGIRYGFNQIKGISNITSNKIVEKREEGNYTSFIDFIKRMESLIDKKQLKNLIFAQSFKELGINSKTLINNLDSILEWNKQSQKTGLALWEFNNNQFDYIFINEDEYSEKKLRENEYESINNNVIYTNNNINKYLHKVLMCNYFYPSINYNIIKAKDTKIKGYLNKNLVELNIKDNYKIYNKEIHKNDEYIVEINNNKIELLVSIFDIDKTDFSLYILYDDEIKKNQVEILNILKNNEGNNNIYFSDKQKRKNIKSNYNVKISNELIKELSKYIDINKIKIKR